MDKPGKLPAPVIALAAQISARDDKGNQVGWLSGLDRLDDACDSLLAFDDGKSPQFDGVKALKRFCEQTRVAWKATAEELRKLDGVEAPPSGAERAHPPTAESKDDGGADLPPVENGPADHLAKPKSKRKTRRKPKVR